MPQQARNYSNNTGSTQQVGEMAKWSTSCDVLIMSGVPQGSVLGLLFNLI